MRLYRHLRVYDQVWAIQFISLSGRKEQTVRGFDKRAAVHHVQKFHHCTVQHVSTFHTFYKKGFGCTSPHYRLV